MSKDIDKPEKPVIPQFVADHIEKHKGEELHLVSRLDFVSEEEFEKKTKEWLYENSYEENLKHQYLLIDAVRYGYEVEKEKKNCDYDNRDGHKTEKEKKYYVFDNRDDSYLGFNDERTKLEWHYYTVDKESFTEAEIKAIDESFWELAEAVSE